MPKKKTGPDVQAALDAIEEVFSDTTYSREQTLEAMQEIKSIVQGNIDAIKADIKDE